MSRPGLSTQGWYIDIYQPMTCMCPSEEFEPHCESLFASCCLVMSALLELHHKISYTCRSILKRHFNTRTYEMWHIAQHLHLFYTSLFNDTKSVNSFTINTIQAKNAADHLSPFWLVLAIGVACLLCCALRC